MYKFRHTTKQQVRTQESLRRAANKALDSSTGVENEDIYAQTFDRDLPPSSLNILDNVILPLTGNNCNCTKDRRQFFTIGVWQSDSSSRLRLVFIQPELSTAMANTKSEHSSPLSTARAQILKWHNHPDSGGFLKSDSKCQIQGRISPYVVDNAGYTGMVSWDHCNVTRSRLVFLFTAVERCELFTLSSRSLEILRTFVPSYCKIVYVESMRAYKLTATPDDHVTNVDANKNSCIFLFGDGSFKVLGRVNDVAKPCAGLKETFSRVMSSNLWRQFIDTLQAA